MVVVCPQCLLGCPMCSYHKGAFSPDMHVLRLRVSCQLSCRVALIPAQGRATVEAMLSELGNFIDELRKYQSRV